jgi:hypothetical protein
MIDCPNGDVRDVLPDYVNHRLGAHRRAEVEQHLTSCEACRDEVELLRDLRATMRRAPRVNVDRIAAVIPPYRAPARRGWTAGWRTAAAVAAVAVGGASLALLRDDAPTDRDVPARRVVQAPTPIDDSATTSIDSTLALEPSGGSVTTPAPTPTRELAMAGGSIGELNDVELAALVDDLESLDALPATEVDETQPLPLSVQEES